MEKNLKFFIPSIYGIIYFTICFFLLFSITAPSDPLQYVKPALHPEEGFQFLDRLILWIWIRLIYFLPIPLEFIGGVATLLLTTFSLIIGMYWLIKNININSSLIFFFFFTLSPFILSISSYTYPMHMLSFIILIVAILVDKFQKKLKLVFFILGFGITIALFSKIQAYSFFIFAILYIFYKSKNIKEYINNIVFFIIGIFCGIITIFIIMILLYDFNILKEIISNYFNQMFSIQVKGRATGGIPFFYLYLYEPTFFISLSSIIIVIIIKNEKLILFSIIALTQLFGLILIYFITQRGGPLIFNYLMDFIIIGLLVASALIGKNYFSKIKIRYLIMLSVMPLFIILYFTLIDTSYKPFIPEKVSKLNLYLMILLFISLLFKNKIVNLVSIFLIFLIVMYNSKLGVFDALYKMNYWKKSYDVAKNINKYQYKYIWLVLKGDRFKINDGSWRIKEIYTTFYNNDNKIISANEELPDKFELIITDSARIINTYGKSIEFKVSDFRDIILEEININDKNLINDKENKLVGLFDYSDNNSSLSNGQQLYVLSSVNYEENNIKNLNLFLQYKINGEFKRFLAEKNGNNFELTLIVPDNATEIMYGWQIHNKEKIKLSNIKFSKYQNKNNNIMYIEVK